MNYESRAIALLNHKYGEGAVIAKIFTEEYGLKSFSVKRNKSKYLMIVSIYALLCRLFFNNMYAQLNTCVAIKQYHSVLFTCNVFLIDRMKGGLKF